MQFCNASAKWVIKRITKEIQNTEQIIWETSEEKLGHELGLKASLALSEERQGKGQQSQEQ